MPAWRQRGVEALRQATLLDGVPPWLPNLAAQMLTKQGGEELALRHLEQTYAVTSDEATREQIRRKLASLRDTAIAAALEREAADLADAHRRALSLRARGVLADRRAAPRAADQRPTRPKRLASGSSFFWQQSRRPSR